MLVLSLTGRSHNWAIIRLVSLWAIKAFTGFEKLTLWIDSGFQYGMTIIREMLQSPPPPQKGINILGLEIF